MNSTNSSTDANTEYMSFYAVTSIVHKVLEVLGVTLNPLCVLVFSLVLRYEVHVEGHMFKYLLCKALCDSATFYFRIFDILYYCTTCALTSTLSMQIWYVWFYYYGLSIAGFASGLFEFAATLDLYTTISKKLTCSHSRIYFVVSTTAIIVFSALIYIYKVSSFEIHMNIVDSKEAYYHVQSPWNEALHLTQSILRDVVVLIGLAVLNIMILCTMKISTRRKKRLQNRTNGAQPKSRLVLQAEQAERHKIMMITFTVILYTAGHFPLTVYKPFASTISPIFLKYYLDSVTILYDGSFVAPFFSYYFFNSAFRRSFFRLTGLRRVHVLNTVNPTTNTINVSRNV